MQAVQIQKYWEAESYIHPEGAINTLQKNKQYYTDGKRVSIGRLISLDESERMMYPNELYYSYYSIDEKVSVRIEEKLVVQYVESEVDTVQHIGTVILLRKIADELDLTTVILHNHGTNSALIHSIMYFMITTQQSTMFPYKEFARSHAIAYIQKDDTDISELHEEGIMSQEIEGFKFEWNQKFTGAKIIITYDSTNCNTKAQGIIMAENGAAKEDKSIPIINQSMAVKQDDGTPLFNEVYSGSTIDIEQCEIMVDTAMQYGYTDLTFLLDRGYISKDNLAYFDIFGYHFILMLKSNIKTSKAAIDSVRTELILNEGNKYYIPFHGVSGTTVKARLFDDQPERYLHIFYRLAEGNRERTYLGDEIRALEIDLEEAIRTADLPKRGKPKLFNGRHAAFFDLQYEEVETVIKAKGQEIKKTIKKLRGYKRKENVIEEELKYIGFFTIVTSEEMTAEQALYAYLTRSVSERVFQDEKSGLGFYSYRVHTQNAVCAKTHIVFLSEILKNNLYHKTRDLCKTNSKFYTIPAIIEQLEKIRAIREPSGTYRLLEPLTARQKEILEPFGIDEDYVKNVIVQMNSSPTELSSITHPFLVQES